MFLPYVKRWSLTAVGFAAIAVIVGYSLMSPDDLTTTLTYTSAPVFLVLVVMAVGYETGRRHDEDFVATVSVWAIVSGTLGVAISQWYFFLLGGAFPGDPFYFTVSSVAVTAAFGTATGYYYTALQRKAEELERTNNLLRDRNQRLDDFAGVVSHDLRNPLTVASGTLDLARTAEDEEELDDLLDRIEDAHDRMWRLIEEILSFTRQGEDAYEPTDVSLENAVGMSVKNTPLPKESLEMKTGSETDTEIHADRDGVQRILENLLRNAVEHAGGGSEDASEVNGDGSEGIGGVDHPTVNVVVGTSDDCVFYVEDDGQGIPEDERENVLEGGYTTRKTAQASVSP